MQEQINALQAEIDRLKQAVSDAAKENNDIKKTLADFDDTKAENARLKKDL